MRISLICLLLLVTRATSLRKQYHGKEYFSSPSALTYSAAKGFCANNGTILVKVQDLDEMNWIKSNMASGGAYWSSAMKFGSMYKWSDREPILWDKWYSGHPAACTGSCCSVYMDTDQTWMTSPCSGSKTAHAVCQLKTVSIPKLNETVANLTNIVDILQSNMTSLKSSLEASLRTELDAIIEGLKEYDSRGEIEKLTLSVQDMNNANFEREEQFVANVSALNTTISVLNEQFKFNVSALLEESEMVKDSSRMFQSEAEDKFASLEDSRAKTNKSISDFAQINLKTRSNQENLTSTQERLISQMVEHLRESKALQVQIWTLTAILFIAIIAGTASLLILRCQNVVLREGDSYEFQNFAQSKNLVRQTE